MEYFNYIKKILSQKQILSLIGISLGLIITSIIEIFGISLIIPIIYTLTSDSFYNELVLFLSNYNFEEITKKDIVIVSLSLFVSLFIFKNFLLGIFFWIESKFIHKTSEKISSDIFKNFLLRDYSFHISENSAHLMSKINNDMLYIKTFFISLLVFIAEIIILIGVLGILFYYSTEILIKVLPVLIFFLLLFYFFFNKLIKKISVQRKKNDYLKTKKIQEGIGGIKEIIAFEKEEYFSKTYNKYINKLIRVFYIYQFLQKLPRIYFETVMVVGIALFTLSILFTTNDIDNFLALLSIFVALSLRLLPSINRIVNSINAFKYCLPAFKSVAKELNFKKRKKNKQRVYNFQNLDFKNVIFKYPKGNFNFNFNLKIKSGDKIAILGDSGSGKSTLLDLIMGFHTPLKGNIFLNKKKVLTRDLQNFFSYVPQFVYIFDDTILENITLGNYESSKDTKLLNQSLKYSYIDKFIKKLPNKIHTRAGDRGSRFSGGQKQRLGIARAFYSNSSILVFDEITSSLDSQAAKNIVNQIIKAKEKTLIFSTHKPELVKNFNKILRIKNGKIYVEKRK
ncbi:MAG: ABC transporter ATP-binding protein [Rickettsiales bacterium TMED254]|nr:MAG: ABC transporter ATP-binding protein [Rickettsiales bacterium TMED254]